MHATGQRQSGLNRVKASVFRRWPESLGLYPKSKPPVITGGFDLRRSDSVLHACENALGRRCFPTNLYKTQEEAKGDAPRCSTKFSRRIALRRSDSVLHACENALGRRCFPTNLYKTQEEAKGDAPRCSTKFSRRIAGVEADGTMPTGRLTIRPLPRPFRVDCAVPRFVSAFVSAVGNFSKLPLAIVRRLP